MLTFAYCRNPECKIILNLEKFPDGTPCHKCGETRRGRVVTSEEESQPAAPVTTSTATASPGLNGVGGWLVFFCVQLTILAPLFTLAMMSVSWEQVKPAFAEFPGLKTAIVWESFGSVALIIYGFIVGCMIWNGNPNGRDIAKRFLLIRLVGFIAFEFITLLLIPAALTMAALGGVIVAGFPQVVVTLAWWFYFKESERVRNTYGPEYTTTLQQKRRQPTDGSSTSPPPLHPKAFASRTSGLAITSLVLGILSFLFVCFASIPAIICGVLALRDIRNSRGQLTGRGLATTGIVIGVLFTLLLPAILLPALARAREAARRSSCANNLKHMGLVCKMFANESKGMVFPELSSEPGSLMWLAKGVYPEYFSDPSVLICPSDSNEGAQQARTNPNPDKPVDDQSYVYLGYVITSDDEMEAFAEVYKQRVAQGLKFNEDLKAPPGRGSMGKDTFYRLREGIERFFLVTDMNDFAPSAISQSAIPVMWDKVEESSRGILFNHVPGGANVLFMDGHVEFVHYRYPHSWPLTERTSQLINEMDTLRP